MELSEILTEYLRNFDREQINEMADELKLIYQNFDTLSNGEKGLAIGYCIGKYGVDIFAGGATIKCVGVFKKLKNANRLANLEMLTLSEKSRESIKIAALKHGANRDSFLKNAKIHSDRQNKHIPGKHNYEPGKSIFEHENPQSLLTKFSGKGRSINNEYPGSPNYKEIVDFKEHIGFWKNKENTLTFPTSKGIIHYSKDGAHIVPANPNSLVP